MICSDCSSIVADEFTFCTNCGQQIETPTVIGKKLPAVATGEFSRREHSVARIVANWGIDTLSGFLKLLALLLAAFLTIAAIVSILTNR